ncbi:MAG: class I poly(R)-hydroxyalkanoic acid synthase [Pseudomonadota bacterium]
MTTKNEDVDKLQENLAKVEALTQRMMAAVSHKKPIRASLQGPGNDLIMKAATAYVAEMMANPSKMMEQQIAYWGQSLRHYVQAQEALTKGTPAPAAPQEPDRRFQGDLWNTHPYFNFIRQQYHLNTKAIEDAVQGMDHLAPRERQRLEYFSRQIVDMFSPTNFLGTNPEALAKAVETDGDSLVAGLENLVRDLEANNGDLLVTLADQDAFRVGENLATTPGKVVFRNHLFELIHYEPTTKTVHDTPLLIFPPWINKFYVMDLKEKNSLIKWVVDQGFTVFVVSWINPDASYANVGLDTYINDGYLTAIDRVKKRCNVEQINVAGYCIAGTTLSLTLSLFAQRGDTSVKSATFFTTLTDFSDQGEVGVFLNDDFVDGIEAEVHDTGVLDSFFMTRTFSFLRSNDLIYGPAIKSYMMGQTPPAFDLLYWNGDATNLPGRMAIEYLRGLCQNNQFADGGFDVCDTTVHLKDVQVPLCAIACETDHIAAWKASYAGVRQMGSDNKTFILSQSGHIAGIINPPSKGKYGHYTNPDLRITADEWQQKATFTPGSWWPRWAGWLADQSGEQVRARKPLKRQTLCDAPGTYVIKSEKDAHT